MALLDYWTLLQHNKGFLLPLYRRVHRPLMCLVIINNEIKLSQIVEKGFHGENFRGLLLRKATKL